jgi:acyl dehydratase
MSAAPGRIPVAPAPLVEGETMAEVVTEPFTRTDFVRYAGASGDFHPIHHDEEYASRAGMPSVFGMGMLHAGMLGDQLARWVGPENIRSFKIRFTGQVWPGDQLTFSGRVVSVTAGEEAGLAAIELEAHSQRGETVLHCEATALVAAAGLSR